MSHYMFTDKKLIKTSDNRVMLLCKVADSSVTDHTGRYHPKYWIFCTFDECTDGFLHSKDAYDKRAKLLFEEEIRKLQDYYDKYEPGRTATEDSDRSVLSEIFSVHGIFNLERRRKIFCTQEL